MFTARILRRRARWLCRIRGHRWETEADRYYRPLNDICWRCMDSRPATERGA